MLKKIYDWVVDHEFSEYMKTHPVIGTEKRILPSGDQVEYTRYEGDPQGQLGQYIYGRIIVSDYVFKEYSENAQNVVIAHEFGHKNTPIHADVLLITMMISGGLGFVFLFLSSIPLAGVLLLLHRISVVEFVMSACGAVLWGVISLFIFVTASWISEGYAELFAINIVGLDAYHLSLRERREKWHLRKVGLFKNIWSTLVYPPKSLVLWIHSKLSKSN